VVRLSNRTGGSHVVSGFSRTEVHTMKSIWRFVRVAVITAAATAAIFAQQRDQPISLKAMGSFYVGGERTEIKHSGGVGSARPGHIWDGGMYVRYMLPSTNRPKVAVVMWS